MIVTFTMKELRYIKMITWFRVREGIFAKICENLCELFLEDWDK